jgi:beta-1,4-galactosyltransferase 1
MHPFLQQQQLDYTVFVVNQHQPEQFNRGALFNVGFIEALKLYPFNCFIFHDVDLLPEDSRNIYRCVNQPRHM